MGEVVQNSLQYLAPEDVAALVTYLRVVEPQQGRAGIEVNDVIVAANWKMHTTPADAGELERVWHEASSAIDTVRAKFGGGYVGAADGSLHRRHDLARRLALADKAALEAAPEELPYPFAAMASSAPMKSATMAKLIAI